MDDCEDVLIAILPLVLTGPIGGLAPKSSRRPIDRPLPGYCGSDAQSRPVGDDIKPGAECLSNTEGTRFADQDEECGLKRILGVVRIADQRPADTPDHLGMSLDQRGKDDLGPLVVPVLAGGLEAIEEFSVRQAGQGADAIKCLEMTQHDGRVPHPPPQVMTDRKTMLRDGRPQVDHQSNRGTARSFVPRILPEDPASVESVES